MLPVFVAETLMYVHRAVPRPHQPRQAPPSPPTAANTPHLKSQLRTSAHQGATVRSVQDCMRLCKSVGITVHGLIKIDVLYDARSTIGYHLLFMFYIYKQSICYSCYMWNAKLQPKFPVNVQNQMHAKKRICCMQNCVFPIP
jgi:hypothetical protein